MKRTIILFLLSVVLVSALAAGTTEYSLSIDWQMSVQGGITYRFNDSFAVEGALGASLMGLIAAECQAVYITPLLHDPWYVSLLAGVPTFLLVPTFDAAMLSLGGGVELGRAIGEKLALALRVGGAFPLFFEYDKEIVRDTAFPLSMWPEASLILIFR